MKINRVHLENYRVHENLDIEFSKGINLLLGQNGKGKSSILEAIGIALFDSKPRTTLLDAVTFGKKSGKIEISFTGVDGEEYIISKRIPSGGSKLSRVSDGVTIDGKADKIKELCGIKGEIKNIYDNIIVAKQNEFVSAFKDTATNRETTFNTIFNTDIYKKIGEKDLLNVYRNYEKLLSIENAKYESIGARILNPEDVKKELDGEIQKKEKYTSQIAIHTKEEEEINSQLKTINELELLQEKLIGNHKYISNTIDNCKSNIEKIDNFIEDAKQAEEIVKNNKEKYEKYTFIKKEIDDKKLKKKEIEKLKIDYENKEKTKARNEGLISKIQGNIEVYQNKIDSNKNISLEKETLAGDLEYNIKEKKKHEIEYREILDNTNILIRQCTIFENDTLNMEQKIVAIKSSIDSKKSAIESKEKMILELEQENISDKLLQLEELEKKKSSLESRNNILATQKDENITAYNMLKSYQCPYLKENCENLKGKDINLYFKEKIAAIDKEYEDNTSEISGIINKLSEKKLLEEKKYKLSIFKKEIEKSKYELLTEEEHYKTLETSLSLVISNYENFRLKNSFENKDELQKKSSTLLFQLENLNLKKDIEELEKLQNIITSLNKDITLYETEKRKNQEQVERLKIQNIEIDKYLSQNQDIIDKFILISKEIEDEEQILKSLEPARNLYIENYKKSLEKDKYIKDKENNANILATQKERLENTAKDIEENKKHLESYNKPELLNNEIKLKEILGTLREELGKTNTQIDVLTKKLEEIHKDESELKRLEKRIKKLKIKLELTQIFRDNVKNMGKEVSKNMLKEIEVIATDNFRKITGRGERIVWSNEDTDKYMVYLVSDTSELKFEQLSGGEQVAVAISIRSAMSNLFTDSKFSIFDEPTNNLDKEKKQSLADSIGEILKNLEQSIIVTHDDTFQEMAEKVIYL